MQSSLITSTTIAALGLAACGAGSVPLVPVTLVPIYADSDDQVLTAGDVITNGGSLTAGGNATSVISLDYKADTATQSGGNILIALNDAGELLVNLDGVTQSYAAADRQTNSDGTRIEGYVVREDKSGKYVGLYSHTGQITDLLQTGGSYAQAISYFTSEIGGRTESRFLYAVIGTETRPDVIGTTGIGNYTGYFRIEAVPTDYDLFSDQRIRFSGHVAMTVTADAAILGTMSDIYVQQPDSDTRSPLAGTIAMQSTPISQDGFSGNLVADTTLSASLLAAGQTRIGNYGGTFYGPSAQQAAGTMAIRANGPTQDNDLTQDTVGVGFFTASQAGQN